MLYVVKAEIQSLEFISDHENNGNNLLINNLSDWSDEGTAFSGPEWVSGINNYPISQTKNTKVIVKLLAKIEPAGLSYSLDGNGENSFMSFNVSELCSVGAPQEVTLVAQTEIPDTIGVFCDSIEWRIRTHGLDVSLGTSGVHKIYTTYATPSAEKLTEKRLNWACEVASGKTSQREVTDRIWEALSSPTNPPYFNLNSQAPSPLWLLMEGAPHAGQCVDLADLMVLALELLGIDGVTAFVYGSTDEDCCSLLPTNWEVRQTLNGTEMIWVMDGGLNRWEAVCMVTSGIETFFYAVKLCSANNPVAILRHWLGDNLPIGNHQLWVYWDIWNQEFMPSNYPPFPVPKP